GALPAAVRPRRPAAGVLAARLARRAERRCRPGEREQRGRGRDQWPQNEITSSDFACKAEAGRAWGNPVRGGTVRRGCALAARTLAGEATPSSGLVNGCGGNQPRNRP